MNPYYTTGNLTDLKKFKTWKECKTLFFGYGVRVSKMHQDEVEAERGRLKMEFGMYPNHLMSKIKVNIFESVTKTKL